MSHVPSETFAALELPFVRHAFIGRIPGVDVDTERGEALRRLDTAHRTARAELGFEAPMALVEQVHGNRVVLAEDAAAHYPVPSADGIVTKRRDLALGIYVADCCPIFIVDPVTPAIGLVHSGKKGTDLGIAGAAIQKMTGEFGSDPAQLIVQLGPCIRPPDYEVDFAAQIVEQCKVRGVRHIFDCGKNTAADLKSYYSYRIEQGKTGRMLALLALI